MVQSSPTLTYETLRTPLPLWNPKAWYYAVMRLGITTVGRLSCGIQIGCEYGFDSGVMLDYVYANQPSGISPLGTFIDWVYLNSRGWRGIRERAQLLSGVLEQVLLSYPLQPVGLLDVACGGGRYDLEVLRKFEPTRISATLRDYQVENVEQAQRLARELDVVACIERADAFSSIDLERVRPRPDVVVVSGLHEILPDDDLIRNHFHQLYRILKPSGTLIFTIQPHHPQLELIARTLQSHTGEPWVMRLRSWQLTRQWAEAAGFRNFNVQMESNGIFGAVTAVKPGE